MVCKVNILKKKRTVLGGIFLLQVCVSEMSSCASMYACVCIHIYISKIIFAKTGKYALIYTMN